MSNVAVNSTLSATRKPLGNQPLERGAESGKKQRIDAFYSINPDCTAIGYPDVTVTRAPSHGQVTVDKGNEFPNFPKNNVRSSCNSVRVPATVYYYTSDDGYTGADNFSVEILTPNGFIYRKNYAVLVR